MRPHRGGLHNRSTGNSTCGWVAQPAPPVRTSRPTPPRGRVERTLTPHPAVISPARSQCTEVTELGRIPIQQLQHAPVTTGTN
eukprot:15434921-Alexandrium_andersonii.AAC.1